VYGSISDELIIVW